MWNCNMKPTPLTCESLKTSRKRRLERIRRFSNDRIPEKIGPVKSSPDPYLEDGNFLPIYGRLFFSPELVNVPLEDLDPFYSDKETFVIVTEGKWLHRFSAQNALNLFSPFNPVRRTCISVLHHWMYRWFMILAAFVDSCLLAQPNHDHQLIVFYSFLAIYTFDFVTNVIAKGLIFDQLTFLRDIWGIVDLLLLLPYYVPFVGRHHFLCGLRSLKIASLVPNLKSTVKAGLRTVGDLRDMFLWTVFATWIFALVGYHFYMDISSQKCVRDFPEEGSFGKNRDLNWHAWISISSNWPLHEGYYRKCGNHSKYWEYTCLETTTCLQIHHQDDQLYSSMGWALLSTTRVMLQDSWDNIYFQILEMGSTWHALYFVVTLFLGSFYTLNMILAVVSKSCDDLQKKLKAEKLESDVRHRSTSTVFRSNDCAFNDLDESKHDDNINADFSCKNPIKGIWTRFLSLLRVIAFDPFMELIMAVATIGNLILLSMDHFGIEKNQQMIMVSGFQVFGTMFAVECALKLLTCGPQSYFKDKWNIFDFWQTVLFLVESAFNFNARWMKTLLSLRSLRILQVTRIWPTLDHMFNGIFSAMGKVRDMTIVAIGLFYIFCVAGVHLFGVNIETRHPKSHWNFRDFWHSFLVMFRLLCGQWQDSLSECMDDYGFTCIPFFISAIIVLDLIVLNLLLVMFLQRFSTSNLCTNRKSETNKVSTAVNRFKRLGVWIKVKFGARLPRKIIPDNSAIEEDQNIEVEATLTKKSFCECPKLRKILQAIMNSSWFKYFNIGNTIIATICLSLRDRNLKSKPQLQDILNVADNITLSFMAVEACLKIVAMRFSAYIKSKWNILDLIIVLGGILNVIGTFVGISTVGFFRSMRVFRLFSNFEGTRVIFNSLGRAMPKIFGIILTCLLIWLVCAIVGVQLLSGRLHYCEAREDRNILNKGECSEKNFDWVAEEQFNFDNIGNAYFRVLEIITFKGWTDSFEYATSSGEIDEQRSFEKSFWISGYFVVVILFGSFFAFNLFTGVLIDGLNEEKAKIQRNATKGKRESGYYESRIYMQHKLEIKLCSANKQTLQSQKLILGVVTSKHFAMVIAMNLLFNTVLLTMEQKGTNMSNSLVLSGLNGVCTAVFASECLLNMFAFKYKFFKNPRNMFELSTELLLIFDILWTDVMLKTSLVPFRPGLLRLVRYAWVSRYLRHVKGASGFRQLLYAIHISLPAFFNICVLLVLVTFTYALLGMELFKELEIDDQLADFTTLLTAFISIFPSITSANWDTLLVKLLSNDFFCDDDNENTSMVCGNDTVAKIYVFSFVLITFVILVNLFTAVIMESCSRAIKLAECELDEEHFETFYKVWSQFVTENSQFVDCNDLSDLFDSFKTPLQILKPNNCAISLMNIPVFKGNVVHCADVLDAAITCLYFRKGVISAEYFNQYQDELRDEKGCKREMSSSTFQQQRERRSAKTIQRAWRNQKSSSYK